MENTSEWAIISCHNCNQIFSVPSIMIDEEEENYQILKCPYCRENIDLKNRGKDNHNFISHQEMNCKVNKITKWVIE